MGRVLVWGVVEVGVVDVVVVVSKGKEAFHYSTTRFRSSKARKN